MSVERTEEEKARRKRVHAMVMIVLGAIMSACALAAGLIAMTPGTFPSWMTGGWGRRERPAYRTPARALVDFEPFSPAVLARAAVQRKLVLLHLAPVWSREARIMEETTYSDPETAAWIARNFIASRADPEESPELARKYGVGAWPSTVIVHADGRALSGAPRLTPKLLVPWAEIIRSNVESDPAKADGFSADARRRTEAVARRPELPLGPADPVWGGVHHSPAEFAKTLSDQARAAASTDTARASSAMAFVERFMALSGGGYASSVAGEVELADGRIEEGSSYFPKDDAARRAAGLPFVDKRLFDAPNAEMAKAVLSSKAATVAQKDHASRTLRLLAQRAKRR